MTPEEQAIYQSNVNRIIGAGVPEGQRFCFMQHKGLDVTWGLPYWLNDSGNWTPLSIGPVEREEALIIFERVRTSTGESRLTL